MDGPQNVQQCTVHKFSVSGTPPYQVTVWPGCGTNSNSESPLESYETQASHFTWNANQKGGTSVQFVVVDGKNQEYYSHDFTIGGSGNSDCLGKPAEFTDGSTPKVVNKEQKPKQGHPTVTSTSTTTYDKTSTQTVNDAAPANVMSSPTPTTSDNSNQPLGGALKKNGALHSFHLPFDAITPLVLLAGSVLAVF